MEYNHGTIKENSKDIERIVFDYYSRTIASMNTKPLKFRWTTYKALEQAEACKLFIAMDDNKTIGFSLYVMQDHLHHDLQRVAHCTMMGVEPEYRGKGIGRELISYAEDWFRRNGVTHMVHMHRTIYKVTPLFESLGFRLDELGYVKEL